MEVSIKKASKSDISELSKLFDAYRVFYKQESDLDLASKFISERIKNSESTIFVAITDKNQYVGFTQLYPSFSSVSAKRTWVLNDLYVQEDARSNGVATKLMNKAKELAKKNQSKGISLSTSKTNKSAQSLYESLGYERDSVYYSYFLTI